jgi:hypothetical protein
MTLGIEKLIRPTIFIAFVLPFLNANGQVSLVENAIEKLKNYKNFSYQFTNKRKDFTIDTVISLNKQSFLKAPGDTIFGYLFKLETIYTTEKFTRREVYDGKSLININPEDSTYEIQKTRSSAFPGTLPGNLNWIENFVRKKPSDLVAAGDTIIDGISNTHLIINTYDTIIDKEHYFTVKHLFIDKGSGVPTAIITRSKNRNFGNGISEYYDEIRYSDYKFDQANVNTVSFTE